MKRSGLVLAAGVTAAIPASFAPAAALNPPRSQPGSVRQSVAGTEVEIVYRRCGRGALPSVRVLAVAPQGQLPS